jgi:hypothetical protein
MDREQFAGALHERRLAFEVVFRSALEGIEKLFDGAVVGFEHRERVLPGGRLRGSFYCSHDGTSIVGDQL